MSIKMKTTAAIILLQLLFAFAVSETGSPL